MKLSARITALLLMLVMLVTMFPMTASATPITWYNNGEEIEAFQCNQCGDYYLMDEGVSYCSVCGENDEYQYCDSCYCSSCGRCEDHCVCDAEETLQFDEGDLEFPEIPTLDDAALQLSDELVSQYTPLEANTAHGTKYFQEEDIIWLLLQLFYRFERNSETVPQTWERSTEFYQKLSPKDTFHFETCTEDKMCGYLNGIVHSKEMERIISHMESQWLLTAGPYSISPESDLKALLDCLIKIARESGYVIPDGAITIELTQINGTTNGQMLPIVGDRNLLAKIQINSNYIENRTAKEVASTVIHEFTHALNRVQMQTVYDSRAMKMVLGPNTTVSDIRLYLNTVSYSYIEITRPESKAEYEQMLEQASLYYTQLDERLARQAAFLGIHGTYAENGMKNPYLIYLLALSHINENTFTLGFWGSKTEYFDKMCALYPELERIKGDFAFCKLQDTYGDLNAILTDPIADNFAQEPLLVFYNDSEGFRVLLPTKAFYDWFIEKTGKVPFDWDEMIEEVSGSSQDKKGTAPEESLPEEKGGVDEPKHANVAIPADVYEYFAALTAFLQMEEYAAADENEYAAYTALWEELYENAELLGDELASAEDAEAIGDEMENLCSEAEQIQGELEGLFAQYEMLSEELEQEYEEALEELSSCAEELKEQYESYLSEDDASGEEAAALLEELRGEYEQAAEEAQNLVDSYAVELEEITGRVDELSERCEEIGEELEALSEELEELSSVSEEYEELSDAMELLGDYMEASGATEHLNFDVPRTATVTVTDEAGKAVEGIRVFYRCPGSTVSSLLGITDEKGIAHGPVEGSSENFGWTVCVGANNKSSKDANGVWYEPQKAENLFFTVESSPDGGVSYRVDASLELTVSEEPAEEEETASFRVTIRGGNKANAHVPNPWEFGVTPSETCKWTEYYDILMETESVYTDEGLLRSFFWKDSMTEEKDGYYGAYLLPRSNDGQLLRQNAQRYFAPLYRWENGKAVSQLVYSEDFAQADPENPDFVPYSSYAFDFGQVPAGSYELVILLPGQKVHWAKVELLGDTTYSAQTWRKLTQRESSLQKVELEPQVTAVGGREAGTITESEAPIFTLAVDARGKQTWDIAGFDEDGRLTVYAPVSYAKMNDGTEYDSTVCMGQIYLLLSQTELRLLPVNYFYSYKIYHREENGETLYLRRFDSIESRPIYALTEELVSQALPLYVSFLEKYYTADGTEHYRTVQEKVNFSLGYSVNPEITMDEVRLDAGISVNENGIQQNYLSSRNTPGEGAFYSFRYDSVMEDVTPASLAAAELFTLRDDNWPYDGIPRGLEACAWKRDGGWVSGEINVTEEGIIYSFIFTGSCSDGHHWVADGETVYCENCGCSGTEEGPQVIEYIVPGGFYVSNPPPGWNVPQLPTPSGDFDFDFSFAGWATQPVSDAQKVPDLYPAGSSYNASLKKTWTYTLTDETPRVGLYAYSEAAQAYRRINAIEDGYWILAGERVLAGDYDLYTRKLDYAVTKLYAVFSRTDYELVTEAPEDWSGEYVFLLEGVHSYYNAGNMRTRELLQAENLQALPRTDYALCLQQTAHLAADTFMDDNLLTVSGNSADGYLLSCKSAESAAPVYLTLENGQLVTGPVGTRFDLISGNNKRIDFRATGTEDYLAVDGSMGLTLGGSADAQLAAYRPHTVYSCTPEQRQGAEHRILVLAQVPLQNMYLNGETKLNTTGMVAALVTLRGNEILHAVEVTDKTALQYDLSGAGTHTVTAVYNDAQSGESLLAHFQVEVLRSASVEKAPAGDKLTLQLGGDWKIAFEAGDPFNHAGQKVYLLTHRGWGVTGAVQLSGNPKAVLPAYPAWSGYTGIPGSTVFTNQTITVTAYAPLGRLELELASTTYQIRIEQDLPIIDPWLTDFPDIEVTKPWFEAFFLDENLQAVLEGYLSRLPVHDRTELLLEGMNIHDLTGIEKLPGVESLWLQNNALTEVNLQEAVSLSKVVLGRQEATIDMKRTADGYYADLSTVVSLKNLQYIRNLSVLDAQGAKLPYTYNAANGSLNIKHVAQRGTTEEITLYYEFEAHYGGGKTAIMTVYLTPRIYETPQAQKGEAILWVKNVIKDSERRADFYFVLTEEGTENSQLISISGNGEAAFPTLCYTTAGTYRYTVCQVIGTEPYQYDDGVYTATVTVADDLSTEVSYMYDGRAAEEIVFNNDWNETVASAALATPTDAAYLTAAGITVSGLEDGGSYAEGDTFTVTSAKACVAAISFDGGESYTELPASPTADENTYTFTLPALTGDFVIGIVLLGDANGDGKVNPADGLRIQRYITFGPDDPYESNYELTALTELAADANGDGKVNTADVLRIQRHITFDPDDPYESNYELCWNVV